MSHLEAFIRVSTADGVRLDLEQGESVLQCNHSKLAHCDESEGTLQLAAVGGIGADRVQPLQLLPIVLDVVRHLNLLCLPEGCIDCTLLLEAVIKANLVSLDVCGGSHGLISPSIVHLNHL